jgi:hypothetical protein
MSDKMEIETKSTSSESTMSLEDSEIENMLLETQGIIEKLDATEKYLADFAKLNSYVIPYTIVTPDKKMDLTDALTILQNTSNASTFGTNMLAFLQNVCIIPEKLSDQSGKK